MPNLSPTPDVPRESRVIDLAGDLSIPGVVSVDLVDASVELALETVLDGSGLSWVAPPASDLLVTLRLDRVPVGEAVRAVAESAALDVRVASGVVRLVERAPDTIGVLSPTFVPSDELVASSRAVLGPEAGIEVAGSSVVVTGRREDVDRVRALADALQVEPPDQWCVTFWILSVDVQELARYGFDLDPVLSITGAIGSSGSTLLAELLLNGIGEARASSSHSSLISRTSAVLVEGDAVKVESVTTTPVPRRTVSPQGTVTTNGFDYIDAGLVIDVRSRPVPGGMVVELRPELSQITGDVEGVPVVARRTLSTSSLVRPGSWVALAGLDELGATDGTSTPWLRSSRRDGRSVWLLAHFARVSFPVDTTPRKALPAGRFASIGAAASEASEAQPKGPRPRESTIFRIPH